MKIKLTYSYDGSKFQGSQTQPNGLGVEDALRAALARIGIVGELITSSRKDKGVHALNQVSCIECDERFSDLIRLKSLANRHTAPYIYIKKIERAKDSFHPRYDAKFRSYRYIFNHGEFSPWLAAYETFLPEFDVKKANEILSLFIGTRDFTAFMKLGSDVKTSVRDMKDAFCYRYGKRTIVVFKANGFLRSQIRLMVASLLKAVVLPDGKELIAATLKLNQNEKSSENTTQIPYKMRNGINLPLKNKDDAMTRKLADAFILTRMPAPAQGLYLHRIFY